MKTGAAREEEGKGKSQEGSGEEGRGLSSLPPGQTSFTKTKYAYKAYKAYQDCDELVKFDLHIYVS